MHKNILLVTRPLAPPWDEASKNFAYDLGRNLANSEAYTVHMMTVGTLENMPDHIVQHPVYTQSHFSISQKIRALFFLWRHRKDFDLVHQMFTPTLLNAYLIKKILHKTGIQTIQTVATLRDDLYSDQKRDALLFGDTIVTYSHYRAQKLQKTCAHKNIITIHPGIDLKKFHPGPKDTALMQRWNIAQQDFVVTYPGEFARLGATDLIVETFLELWKDPKNHTIKYLCACRIKNDADAQKKKEVMARIAEAGHNDKVIFTDTFSDMNAVYTLSDTVIFPVASMAGKFDIPLAMIEPYACKKPVIASDLPIFAEFSNPDINVIIPTGDKNALAQAILNLRDDRKKCAELGGNAYAFVHDTFSIKKSAASYQKIYDETV